MLTQHTTPVELAEALAAALVDLDPAGQRLAIGLYRLLAAGRPVAAGDLAAVTGLPKPDVAATLSSWPAVFTGSQGRVPGFWGLASSEPHPRTGTSPAGGSCTPGAPGTPSSCPPGSPSPHT